MSNTNSIQAIPSLALSVYLPSAVVTSGGTALGTILPLYVLARGDGLAMAALVFAMLSSGSMLANLPASIALAKFGTRAVVFGGMVLFTCGALGLALSHSIFQIMLFTFIFGMGSGTWLLSRLSYVSHQIPIERRGKTMVGLAGVQRIGMFIGPTLGGLGALKFGYESVFVAIAVGAVACVIPLRTIRETRTGPLNSAAEDEPHYEKPLTNVFTLLPKVLYRHRQVFARAGIFVFALQFVRGQRRLLITLWGATLGLDVDTIGLLLSFSAAADMLSLPIAGYLMDKQGRKIAGLACICTMSIALGLLITTEAFWGYAILVVLSGFGNGLGGGIIVTLGSDLAPKQNGNQFLGVWRLVTDFGSLSGPLVTSVTAGLFVALNLTVFVGLAGGAALWFLVEETLPSKSPKRYP